MKIVLLGPSGQVGWELQRALAPLGELWKLDLADGADFAQPEALIERVRALAPDAIVNAAAYTAVDKAESEPELAQMINAVAPGHLARLATELSATLLHYSTDYVFDGSGHAPRDEDATTGPLSVYGASKLAGEDAIRASGCRHLILRTSWVYASRGDNFIKTMLRLAGERERLTVIADQIGAPTGAELLADASAHALRTLTNRPSLAGTYHLTAGGETSWHGYAEYIMATARTLGATLCVREVAAIPTTDYPTPARRPLNSRLDCRRFTHAFDLNLPQWQTGVARMLTETL